MIESKNEYAIYWNLCFLFDKFLTLSLYSEFRSTKSIHG